GTETKPGEEAGRIDAIAGGPASLPVADLRHESIIGAELRRKVGVGEIPVPVVGGMGPRDRGAWSREPLPVPPRVEVRPIRQSRHAIEVLSGEEVSVV